MNRVFEKNKENESLTLSETEDSLKFQWTTICFNGCVQSMSDKFLNPYEKMCMDACLKNVLSVYVEIRNAYDQATH